MWLQIASHLKMSVQRAQQEITSSEFLDWVVFIDEEPNMFCKEDFYLAQIAAEIRKTIVKHPEKVSIKSFLMKFARKEKEKKKETKIEASKRMKSFFGIVSKPKTSKGKK